MKSIILAVLFAALVAVANCASYAIIQPVGHVRVARSPQFFPGGFGGSAANASAASQSFGGGLGGFGGSAASANAASQSFGGGLGGFGGSAASANAASQSFGGGLGFPGGFSGSAANAGAQSIGFGR